MMDSCDILQSLIGFATISRTSNDALIAFVTDLLAPLGADICRIDGETDRANLWITIGPKDTPGIVLSGHSDVVPVAGQDWSRDPFTMTQADGRLYGRGAADMKGFLACAMACAVEASRRTLKTPLHLAISYDEEIGCVGVRPMLDMLAAQPVRPLLCLIGEPTSMRVVTAHKGKMALRATCIGREAHSALAPTGLNAVTLASRFVVALDDLQREIASGPAQEEGHAIPYSTVHVGVIGGGEALNIVPGRCTVDFEIRNIAAENASDIADRIRAIAAAIVAPLREDFPEAAIRIEEVNAYPGLDTHHEEAIRFISRLAATNDPPTKVAFGTEAGLFSNRLGIPAIVCGPGSMDQGHKPDEYVTLDQLARCDAMLSRLLTELERGVAL